MRGGVRLGKLALGMGRVFRKRVKTGRRMRMRKVKRAVRVWKRGESCARGDYCGRER